jgi:LysR family hydrogen peroxide-inducible transcriptional activator
MITIKQLKYAIAVEQTLHFKKAAELCNISQSAFSNALNELEKQLGVKIFERDTKKVLVTPIGKRVLMQARAIMFQVNELEDFSKVQKAPLSYPLSIGMIPTIAPYLLPKLQNRLKQDFPLAKLNIVENQSQVLVDMVRRGDLDTAILALPYPCDDLLSIEFWQEDFFWVTSEKKRYRDQTQIKSDEIDKANLMLLGDGHCLKDHVLSICNMNQNSVKNAVSAVSINTLLQMVASNLGTTLIPEMALHQLHEHYPDISALRLQEPGPHRQLAFVMRPNFTRIQCIENLITICKQSLS